MGKPVNNIRIYIVNLNSSDPIALMGKLPLLISCKSTAVNRQDYQVSYELDHLTVTSSLDGERRPVSVPISSTPEGAIIHMETVVFQRFMERWIR